MEEFCLLPPSLRGKAFLSWVGETVYNTREQNRQEKARETFKKKFHLFIFQKAEKIRLQFEFGKVYFLIAFGV